MGKHVAINVPGRKCVVCGGAIGRTKAMSAKYCTESCKNRFFREKRQTKEREEKALVMEGERLGRRGHVFKTITNNGMGQRLFDKELTVSNVAELLEVTPAAVSRGFEAWKLERLKQEKVTEWVMPPEIAAMFPKHLFDELADIGLDREGEEDFEVVMFRLEFAFWQYEHRYFTIGSRQDTFIIKEFHVEIVREFIIAQVFATRVLILTPPRHGKSELVLRFVAWLIIMFPNIQVLWVAANKPLAVSMTTKLKGVFESNTQMIEETLPPYSKYGDKGTVKWTEDSFTLYTRTDHTLKSATFTAIGSSATVAGRDCDFIGIDDLEERKTVETFGQRQKSKRKHAEIMERQENFTGVVTIASRQHPDDIPNALLQQSGDDAWRVHQYPAHAEDCVIDEEDKDAHVACMLMPSIRSYRWLIRQKDEAATLNLPGLYELRYLQQAIPVDGMIFNIDDIRLNALDRSRVIGTIDLKVPYRLIAGMDPATRGYQAAVLWAWTKHATYLIDIVTTRGLGQLGAVQLFDDWFYEYGLTHWVYEDNISKEDFFTRPDLIAVKNRHDLTIEAHTTGNEKRDAEVGISSMAPWYHSGKFVLPYGNTHSVSVVKELLRQLQLWTTDGLQKGATVTDIKMASWLPYVRRLVRWDRTVNAPTLELVSDQSYPDLGGNTPAWGYTDPSHYGIYGG